MSTTQTGYEHIARNEKNVPVVRGTRFKVSQIAIANVVNGWAIERIAEEYPLSLPQIYSALAYFWEHRDEIELEIQNNQEVADRFESMAKSTTAYRRLLDRLKPKGDSA